MAADDAADARRARLRQLQARMGDVARANRREVAAEQTARREAAQNRETIGKQFKLKKAARMLDERDIAERGENVERHRALNYSIEENDAWEEHLAQKERRRDKGLIDFQDLAERSYLRQVAQLKPDLAAYSAQKTHANEAAHERTEAPAPAAGDPGALVRAETAEGKTLVPASEANVPPAVATYGQHRPSAADVDRLVSHLNHECVPADADRTTSSAAAGSAKTIRMQRSTTSTSATSTSTARWSATMTSTRVRSARTVRTC